jgi:RNA polymerase sigma-70 factor (ECF subfamily)
MATERRLRPIAVDEGWGEILAAAQKGDVAAYNLFIVSVTPFISALIRKRLWATDGHDDVLQEVLLTVHRIRHTYEAGRPIKPWLATIAARRSIDESRRRARISAMEVHDAGGYQAFADPQARDEARNAAQALKRMTSGLSPVQQQALDLVKLKEMSLVEASIVSGRSVGCLKVNIHRAMKRMRQELWKALPE